MLFLAQELGTFLFSLVASWKCAAASGRVSHLGTAPAHQVRHGRAGTAAFGEARFGWLGAMGS